MKVFCTRWDDSDFIISMRPDNAMPWQDLPVGSTVSESESRIIAKWLEAALPELSKMIKSAEKFEAQSSAGSGAAD